MSLISKEELAEKLGILDWGTNEYLKQRVANALGRAVSRHNYKEVVFCDKCINLRFGEGESDPICFCGLTGAPTTLTDYCSRAEEVPKHKCGDCIHYVETKAVRACLLPLSTASQAEVVRVKRDRPACVSFKERKECD